MGVRFPSVQAFSTVVANVGINIETTLIFTGPLVLPLDNAVVLILWSLIHTIGTTAVSTAVRIRRGVSAAGVLLNSGAAITAVAGNVVTLSGFCIDTPGAAGALQYSLGCIDPASTVAGAVAEAGILAFAL